MHVCCNKCFKSSVKQKSYQAAGKTTNRACEQRIFRSALEPMFVTPVVRSRSSVIWSALAPLPSRSARFLLAPFHFSPAQRSDALVRVRHRYYGSGTMACRKPKPVGKIEVLYNGF